MISITHTNNNHMKRFILSGLALLYATLSIAHTNRVKAEVFVEILDRGTYTVYLENEFSGSSAGKFRFYDVFNSTPTLSVLQGTTVLFKKKISIQEGVRTILQFSQRGGLKITGSLNIFRNRVYALNDWNDYIGSYNTGVVPPRYDQATSLQSYNDLLRLVKAEGFDDGRMRLIYAATKNGSLSAARMKQLLTELRFEENKLEVAKNIYAACIDKENYFTLVEAFTFRSNKEALLDFIKKQ
ncbi:MAG: DUF4476 domain-containing protein [Pedobacter sp.]|nr:MAG: DUF4476 domain-containing protein [Pedobacter sp.]